MGTVDLAMCLRCTYIGNRAFRPELLSFSDYNISPEFSQTYRHFIDELSSQLIERYDLREKSVVDIGCGNGYFLKTICSMGGNRGLGFDPSFTDVDTYTLVNVPPVVEFVRDYYSEAYSGHGADFVCCRQVVDHLGDPKPFVEIIRDSLEPRSVAYFEVTNAEKRVLDFAPWSIGYEHASWFLPESLSAFLKATGFEPKKVTRWHSNSYLGIEVLPIRAERARSEYRASTNQRRRVAGMRARFDAEMDMWRNRLDAIERSGKRVLPWGAGELAIGFLNLLGVRDLAPFVIDINPARIGKYLPGTGQLVVAPEFAKNFLPDVVIVTNQVYETEIRDQIRGLGLNPEVLVL